MTIYEKIAEASEEPKHPKPEEWKVYYHAGFWGHKPRERAGKEILIRKKFIWGEDRWHVPAVYSCSAGLVVDICVEVEPEKIRDFIGKIQMYLEREDHLSDEEREKIENINPLNHDFHTHLTVNGKELQQKSGYGLGWIPKDCLTEGQDNEQKAERLMEHYDLDKNKGWSIYRLTFPWPTGRKMTLHSMEMALEQRPVAFAGPHFQVSSVGENVKFIHPITGAEHTLTVRSYEKNEMNMEHMRGHSRGAEMEYPTNYVGMEFTVEPDISRSELAVYDCAKSDQPRMLRKDSNELEPVSSASVAIIGGADGPTSIFIAGKSKSPAMHGAFSSLHFEPVDQVEWRMVFRRKMLEDIAVTLL